MAAEKREEKLLAALARALERQNQLLETVMTALQTLTASIAALTTAVDSAVLDANTPSATDAQILGAATAIDTQVARLIAAITPVVPPVAPPAPAAVTATAGTASVALSWAASPGATGYNVKRSMVHGGPYTNSPGVPVAVTTFIDGGLAAAIPVFYVVSAVNSAGESPNSAEVTATPV